jgi:N-acetyl-anhydromuramyl-L-alanine amidase AmpD
MNIIEKPSAHGGGKQTPNRIIVHAMGSQIDYEGKRLDAADFLQKIGLSAHALIANDGTVIRCRNDDRMAWHAKGHNSNTLGVEVLVKDAHNISELYDCMKAQNWPSSRQLWSLIGLVVRWCEQHDIQKIQRHSDIDSPRKKDPGTGFPWDGFVQYTNFILKLKGIKELKTS